MGYLRHSWDLCGAGALALALLVNNWLAPSVPTVWSVVLGLLVGLILPGYTLVALLFPEQAGLDEIERWGLSLVLSIVIVIVAALLLSEVHIRMDARSVTATMSGITLVLAAAAAVRREALPLDRAYVPRVPRGRWPFITLTLTVILGLTTWLIVGANLRAVSPDFSITSPSGQLSGYPFEVPIRTVYPLTLHVDNPTDQALAYRLVISDGGRSDLQSAPIGVPAHSKWSRQIILPADAPPRNEVVRFTLYQGKQATRKLWIRYRIVAP